MLKVLTTSFLPILLGLSLVECNSKTKSQAQPPLTGVYHYSGYDKTRAKVVEGELTITAIESDQIKGHWQLKAIGNPTRIGPQLGSGNLVGEIKQDNVTINLSPNMADNNVYLAGKINGSRFRGTWSYSGFAGVINEGTFEALRR